MEQEFWAIAYGEKFVYGVLAGKEEIAWKDLIVEFPGMTEQELKAHGYRAVRVEIRRVPEGAKEK